MAILAFVAGVGITLAFTQSGDDESDDQPRPDTVEDASETTATTAADGNVATTLADVGTPVEPECPPDEGPDEPVRSFTGPPPMCIDPDHTYVATVETTRGEFEITLDPSAAPQAVNSFVFLARWRFYEGAGFFRVIPGFSITTGDPLVQNGLGDPGYSIPDEPPNDEPYYPELSVAMVSQGGEDGPDSSGSIFFVVTGPASATLSPRYSVFGHVTAGDDVVRAIEATGDLSTDTGVPIEETVIERITVSEE